MELTTNVPMARGFGYLIAIMDWASRRALSWRLSNIMDPQVCLDAHSEALARFPALGIFNTDQGAQLTTCARTTAPLDRGIAVSMDGKGRWMDNVFIERLWRSLKYEEVYLHAYDDLAVARGGICDWFTFCNDERPHQALGYQTPQRSLRHHGKKGRMNLSMACAQAVHRLWSILPRNPSSPRWQGQGSALTTLSPRRATATIGIN